MQDQPKFHRRDAVKMIAASTAFSFSGCSTPNSGTTITDISVVRIKHKRERRRTFSYFLLHNSSGLTGIGGPLMWNQQQSFQKLLPRLKKILVGANPETADLSFYSMWNQLYPENPLEKYSRGIDPLSGKPIWNTRRKSRHTQTGSIICALSAVDNSVWDIRGKLVEKPVYKMLKGKRVKLNAYSSILPGPDIKKELKRARDFYDIGYTRQKWFFRYGPVDGKKGFSQIVNLVEGLRNELGDKATLMFDFAIGDRGRCDWDVPYAIKVAKAIETFNITWLEEPFSPEEIDSYRKLKDATDIPLACGEHLYSRWNLKPFLDEGLIKYVQVDPEWCGGVSETLEICELVKQYDGLQLIPHGHHALSPSHIVSAEPEDFCPLVEHGTWLGSLQEAQTRIVTNDAGIRLVPNEPGLGPGIDWNNYKKY